MAENADNKATILIADDDRVSRKLAATALRKHQFNVIEAGNGEEGVASFTDHHIDMVLLDVVMPVMDGFEACTTMRKLIEGKHIPIVMMTGLHDTESINKAFAAGATDFITKPINFTVLDYRVEFILRAQESINTSRQNTQRLSLVQDIAKIAYYEIDVEQKMVNLSNAMRDLFQLPYNDVCSLEQLLNIVHKDDQKNITDNLINKLASHEAITVEHRVVLPNERQSIIYQESEATRANIRLVVAQDVTERRKAEADINQLAYFDKLTGLPNRSFLHKHLDYVLDLSKRHQRLAGVFSIDLDLFQRINDNFGHHVGDKIITETAERLSKCMRQSDCVSRPALTPGNNDNAERKGDTVAHLGGDEFTIILGEISRPEDAAHIARRIMSILSAPYHIEEHEIFITVSIGIGLFPDNGENSKLLLQNATSAMHHAKSLGRNNFQFYSKSLNQETMAKLEMENDLRRAMEHNELELYYQPKVCSQTGLPIGMEALIRWNHPEKGLVPPFTFIPLAEETGLIEDIGNWVLREACRQNKAWQDEGMTKLRIAVNLSALQFNDRLIDSVTSVLKDTQLPYEYLELEITESILMDSCDTSNELLMQLKKMGIHIAVDDFGTG
ncbi:MAG: diguanylate cyclase [Methylococcales bacterium]|nr:diguanylate cyclase [Methylococcales bacterium]